MATEILYHGDQNGTCMGYTEITYQLNGIQASEHHYTFDSTGKVPIYEATKKFGANGKLTYICEYRYDPVKQTPIGSKDKYYDTEGRLTHEREGRYDATDSHTLSWTENKYAPSGKLLTSTSWP